MLHPGVPVMWRGHIRDLSPTAEGCMGGRLPNANDVALGTTKVMRWWEVMREALKGSDSRGAFLLRAGSGDEEPSQVCSWRSQRDRALGLPRDGEWVPSPERGWKWFRGGLIPKQIRALREPLDGALR